MTVSAGTLTLDFIANTQSLDKAMADMQRRALEYAKSIESDFARSLSIKPVVDDSALTALNKHLDLKQKHFKEVQRSFDSHPLTPKVNTASIDRAINKVQVLQDQLGELAQRGSIGVRISSPTEQAQQTQQDNNQSSGGAKIVAEMEAGMSKVAQNMNTKIEQAFQASFKGITTTVTAPLRAILTGLFEGIGHNVASVFSRGAIATFQRESGISLKNTGSRAGGYAGRVINELRNREGGSESSSGGVVPRPPVKPKGGGGASATDEIRQIQASLQEISKALELASSGLNKFDGGATRAAGEAIRLASALAKLYGNLASVQKANPGTNKAASTTPVSTNSGGRSGSSLQAITPKGFLRGDKADLTPEIAKRQVEAVRSRLQKRLDDLRQIPGGASSKQIGVLMNALATVQTRIANDIADPTVPENVRRSLGQLRRVNSKLAQTRRDLGAEAAKVGFINAQGSKGRGGLGLGGKALGAGVGASILGAGSAFAAPGPGVGLGFVGALPFDPTLGLAALGIGGSLAAARFAPKLLRRAGLNRTASVLETDVGGLATSAVSGVFRSLQGNVGGAVKGAAKGAAKALKQGVDSISAAVSSIVPPRPTTGTLGAGERFFRGLEAMFYRSPLFRGNVPPTQRRSLTSEATGFLFSGAALAAPGASLGLLAAPLLTALTPLLTTIGLVGNALAPLVGTIATTLKQTDPIRARLEYVSGGASGAGKNRDYVQGIAEKYNIATLPSLDQFSKLAAATKGTRLEGDGLKSLFEGIATAAKGLSLSTEDLNLVMYAFTQIASKGKLSAEEVRLQLAEKFPGIINILSKSLNMTVPEFNKVLEQGKLISEEVLPKLGEALQREYGDAAARASGNFLSALTKVDNAIFRLKDSVSQTLAPIFATITSTFGDAINVFAQNAQRLVPIFSVIVIGAAAQFFVGLTTILEGSGVLAKMQGFLIPMFGRLFATLTPFAVGIFADFLDDMFGAKTSVMDNMMKGVYNIVLTTLLALDDLKKNISGLFEGMPSSEKNPFSGLGKVFRDIGSGLQSVKKFIAGTPVEFTALFLILAQTYVLLEKGLALVMARFGVTVGQLAMSFGRAVISGKVFNSVLNTLSAGLNKAQLVATAATTALILFFAKADFSNELGSAFDKLGDRTQSALEKIRTAAKKTGGDLADFASSLQEIESKGFDFTIGFGETVGLKPLRTDDITKFMRQRARDLAELYKKTGLLSDSGYQNQLEEINIRFVTIGEKQFIDNLDKLKQRAVEIKEAISISGLTEGTFNTNEFGKSLSELKKYDEQIKTQQLRRVDILASKSASSPEAIAELARIDDQIKKLLELRNKAKQPLEDMKNSVLEEADVLKSALELINNSNLPEKYKELARQQLQPSIDLAEQAKKKMEELGLIDLSPLANEFTEVIKRIEKLDKALEKAQNSQKLKSIIAQTEIQSSLERGEITPEQAQRRSNEEELRALESNERTLADYISRRQLQLRDLYAIPNPNEQQKETIEKTEKDLQGKEIELKQAQLSIKQKSNELKRQLIDLGKAIEDYYRGIQRTAADIALSVRETTNTVALTNAKNKLKTAILGFQDNFVSQFVDSLVGILDALNEPIQQAIDAQRQIQQNNNQYQDTIRQGQELVKQPEGTTAGTSGGTTGDTSNKVVALRRAIIGQESGYNYRAENIHSGAAGFAQVMPENIAPWTKEALGRSLTKEQFLNDPQAQIKTTDKQVEKYLSNQLKAAGGNLELAVRRVAASWYGGEDDARMYDDPKPQYYKGHKYPSFREYTTSVLGKFQAEIRKAPAVPANEPTTTPTPATRALATSSLKPNEHGLVNPVPGSTRATNSRGYAADSGLDIYAPVGTKVVAAAAGILEYAEQGHNRQSKEDSDPTSPNFQPSHSVRIKLDKPIQYQGQEYPYMYYTHLRGVAPEILNSGSMSQSGSKPIRIEAGQALGEVGVANKIAHLHVGILGDRAQKNVLNYQDVDKLIYGKGGGLGSGIPIAGVNFGNNQVKEGWPATQTPSPNNSLGTGGLERNTKLTTENLQSQNQSVIDRYRASSALSETNTNLQIEQAFRQLQQGYRDQKSRILGFVRRDEDNDAELEISTPEKQYNINQRNTIRKYDEFYRELFGEKERLLGTMGATRSSINSIKQELASDNLDAAQTLIYKKSLAELEKALQGTVADLLKTDSLLQKQPEALARALEDNKGKYILEATKLAAEFRDQYKGQAIELTRGMAARAEAYQKRNPYDMSMGDPLLYNYQANVAEQALNFDKSKREYEELGRTGQRSPEQVKSLLSMLEKLNRQKLDSFKQDYEQGMYERGLQQDDAKFSEKQRVFQSGQDLLGARSGYLKTKGLGIKAQQLDKEVAIAGQNFSYESSVREIDKLVEAKEIAIDKAKQLKADLEQINQIKLEDIRAQFDPWNQVLVDTQQGFQGFFSSIISGSQGVGDAFSNMVSSIANSLASLAAQWAVNEIVSGIFGMGKGGSSKSSSGGIWDAIMGGNPEFAIADTALKIFGFKDGGVVDPVDHSDYRKGTNPIAKALQREGSRSVLAALTPGEMVLNLEQTRRYHELGVDRVLNFREGGVVPGGSTPSFSPTSGGSESIHINIPVQINSNGGSERDLGRTAAGLGQALRAVVIQEIQNQKRSGGLLQGV